MSEPRDEARSGDRDTELEQRLLPGFLELFGGQGKGGDEARRAYPRGGGFAKQRTEKYN